MRIKEIMIFIIQLAFICLWIYAAFAKWNDGIIFLEQLKQQPVPDNWAPILYWVLPSFELALAALLINPLTRLFALWASSFTILFFTIYVLLVVSGFIWKDIPCACMGIFKGIGWVNHFWFNLVATGFGSAALVLQYSKAKFLQFRGKC